MNLSTSLLFLEDAGHGWLRVPLADLVALGIEQDISPYSYVHEGYAYLEEDCDYTVYMQAYLKVKATEPDITNQYVHTFIGRSSYSMYLPPEVTDEWLEKNCISRVYWPQLKAQIQTRKSPSRDVVGTF